MSGLTAQAQAAYQEIIDAEARKEQKSLEASRRKASRERTERIKRNDWLLQASALHQMFPGVEFVIVDAVDAGRGPNPTPFFGRGQMIDLPAALLVREKGAAGTFIPTFRISRKETAKEQIDIVGEPRSALDSREIWQLPNECGVTTAADVGRWLKRKRDDMDRSYRENPD